MLAGSQLLGGGLGLYSAKPGAGGQCYLPLITPQVVLFTTIQYNPGLLVRVRSDKGPGSNVENPYLDCPTTV
jgi:hypothetical protein